LNLRLATSFIIKAVAVYNINLLATLLIHNTLQDTGSNLTIHTIAPEIANNQ
jgi:hypothetical protein